MRSSPSNHTENILAVRDVAGAGKRAALMCGMLKQSIQYTSLMCEVCFLTESAPRTCARSIFGRKVLPARERGLFSMMKCAPLMCAAILHKCRKPPEGAAAIRQGCKPLHTRHSIHIKPQRGGRIHSSIVPCRPSRRHATGL